jgi:outer membrane protein assembly factor BamB
LIGLTVAASPSPAPAQAPPPVNWPAYLGGAQHDSYSPQAAAVTTSNAASMTAAWHFQPDPPPIASLGGLIYSSPVVYGGVVYIGANNGTFYALDESSGTVVWKRFFGFTSRLTCPGGPEGAQGFVSSPTVATDPVSGSATIYINSPDGYLYALDPSTGNTIWRSVVGIPGMAVNSYYAWSSPAVANGYVYVGISSQCNYPWIHGGVAAYRQHSGQRKATFYNVPNGGIGASVWSSVAVTPSGDVIETSGSGPYFDQYLGVSESIVELDGKTLQQIDSWQIPHTAPQDSDFGASPTIFSAVLPGSSAPVTMIGACNKNGKYYALRADDLSAGPVWSFIISKGGSECVTSAAWNGTDLFFGGPSTVINGTRVAGAISEIDPATGATVWETSLPGPVFGAVALDGSGVVAVATYGLTGTQGVYLVDASNGTILSTLRQQTGCGEFSQPVFADNYVLSATLGCGMTAYSVASSSASSSRRARAAPVGGSVSSLRGARSQKGLIGWGSGTVTDRPAAASSAQAGSGWSFGRALQPSGSPDSELLGVSCVASGDCVAVGGEATAGGNEVPLAEEWDGSTWVPISSPVDPSGSPLTLLYSVSCLSINDCMAVGQYNYQASGVPETLAEQWNGTTWSIVDTPLDTTEDGSYLTGVSCISATSCEAVGYSITTHVGLLFIAEVWNGSTWSSQTIPQQSHFEYLWGVSCTPSGGGAYCDAVGYYQSPSGAFQPLAEVWDGTAWSIDLPLVPSGSTWDSYMEGVSCVSSTDCEAVGYANDLGTLAEVWDGTSWSIQATPNPSAGAPGSQLSAVSCTSASSCTAVGQYNVNTAADPVMLTEAWDGTSWTTQTTPASTGASYLRSVSCVTTASSAYFCNSVGHHYRDNGLINVRSIIYSG